MLLFSFHTIGHTHQKHIPSELFIYIIIPEIPVAEVDHYSDWRVTRKGEKTGKWDDYAFWNVFYRVSTSQR